MKRYIPSENVIKRKYDKVVESNIKLLDEIRYLKVDVEKLNQDLMNEKNAYNSMYNMYTEKEQEIERLTAESTEWESKCYKYQDIIKEVREYIEDLYDVRFTDKDKRKILEILEKEKIKNECKDI